VPQNFDQLEAQISSAPEESGEHEAKLDLTPARPTSRREAEFSLDAPGEARRPDPNTPAGMSALRAPTPARGEQSTADVRPVTPAVGRPKLPLTMPVPSVPPEVVDGEADLERHRARPQTFVEPPSGLPLFARVAIALVLFALLSFAGWHLMHQ
jgi:hypothetical protein